jgi:repressor LexA
MFEKQEGLTPRQELVLEFVHAYIKLKGYPPSYNNIAQGMKLKSRSNIHRLVHELRQKGYLKVQAHKFRSLRVADKGIKKILAL